MRVTLLVESLGWSRAWRARDAGHWPGLTEGGRRHHERERLPTAMDKRRLSMLVGLIQATGKSCDGMISIFMIFPNDVT